MSLENLTRQDSIRYLLNRLALELFPPDGHLKDLAADLGVHPTTLSVWMQTGSVPRSKADWMQRRYGPDLAPADLLSSADRV